MAEPALHSALIVAVPEATVAVEEWLERTAHSRPSNGVPAHITITYPFIPAVTITDAGQFPPYEEAFDSIVPPLTVAEGDAGILKAEADVAQHLPITARVRDVVLIEEVEPDSARWTTRARLRLRAQ